MKSIKQRIRVWRWAAFFSVALMILSAWVVFDSLFAPFGENAVQVEIPNLCGQALEAIELADWAEVKTEYRYDANTEAGVILSQTPVGGSRRKLTAQNPSCSLTLVVSLGEETVMMPDVMGKDYRAAESALREMGLTVEVHKETGAYPEGSVFAIEPRAGTEMPIGSKVILTVSAGTPSKTVIVPDVRGMSRSDALVRLWLSELAVENVIEEASDAVEGRVIRQSHQPGTVVAAGTKLTLYVSRELDE